MHKIASRGFYERLVWDMKKQMYRSVHLLFQHVYTESERRNATWFPAIKLCARFNIQTGRKCFSEISVVRPITQSFRGVVQLMYYNAAYSLASLGSSTAFMSAFQFKTSDSSLAYSHHFL